MSGIHFFYFEKRRERRRYTRGTEKPIGRNAASL